MTSHIRYFARLTASVLRQPLPHTRRARVGALLLAVLALTAASSHQFARDRHDPGVTPELETAALQARVQHLAGSLTAIEGRYQKEAAPLARVIRRYHDDAPLARHIAVALVREAKATDLDPRLLLAVLLVENPAIDPAARSFVDARGLMQVMPFHQGHWPPCGSDLDDVDANICTGARIFAHYLGAQHGNVEQALLRYNGCVHGTNTRDCNRYPYAVYARAGRASILAWLRQSSAGHASP